MPFLKYLKTHTLVRYLSPATTPTEFTATRRVTIGELPDNVLLNIFRHYLDVSPRHWPRLVHICRSWRRIVFASQQSLHLRIFCTHGTPVLKTLRYWPAMPIVVEYGGSLELPPPAPEDDDNVITALKQSDRVSSINLTITNSLLKKLSLIERPFLGLEDLVLLSRDGVQLTLPNAFMWGPRLRRLHLTRIATPPLFRLLRSSTNLVDLRLHGISSYRQFPPEALPNALSGMAQLQSLSLHFPPIVDHHDPYTQLWRRNVLPVLTRLEFRGFSQDLESFVARIDAPHLGDIELAFLNENAVAFLRLRDFIDRIEIHKLHRQAHILSSDSAISISLTQPGAPTCLKLQLCCKPMRKQLLFMTRVCVHLSASLFNVKGLCISTTRPSVWGDRDYSGWRDLLNSFTSVQQFRVAGNFSTNIMRALQLPERGSDTVLPSLYTLYIAQPGPRHVPLRDAVVTFMISRRLSGHPVAVEYERLSHVDERRGTGPTSQQVTIETLSDDVFLNIFRDYLDATPRGWPTLTYVCQRWRQIVHTAPLGLGLRLYFTPGTPVLNALDCWHALPIIVKYGGFPNLDPPAPEDDDSIMAALKQSGRVNSINLTVTRSLAGKLSTISEPFSELEELVLLSRDNMQLTLPTTFRLGPRLRTIQSTRIAFPSFPQLLSHSHDLVDIQLHEIPSARYFTPEAFANALSGMTHLRTLSLHFLSFPPRRNYLSLPPLSAERVVLPALMFIKYRGTSKYLDGLVARIDAPSLGDIDIIFFSQPTMDSSQLGRFVERTGIQTPLNRAEVQTSGHSISISFTNSGGSTPVRLQISCKQLDWQLSSMAQVCDQFSPFLFGVNNLCINMTQSPNEQYNADSEQWLEFIRTFGGATDLPVASELTTTILCALGLVEEGHTTVLPSLRHLHIENPMAMNEPSWDGLLSFITLRSRSGHPVQVNVPFDRCRICHASFREQKGLNHHFVDEHRDDGIFCWYCRDFDYKAGYDDLLEHLKTKHPKSLRRDERILGSSLTPDSLAILLGHSRAPDTVVPSTTVTPNG